MKNNSKKLKVVRRGGGLIETNSSSSHAVSICMDAETNLKPGDADFDLDIKNGVLFIPIREGEFGWQWEKSNSCLTKLQYVCGFFFNKYQKPEVQKSQKKLEKILKKILGVDKVVFEWVEQYVEDCKDPDGGENYFDSPEINHNSYSEMREEILENEDTIRNFILNPKSWWYGGNDNSDPPFGFYSETKITEEDNTSTEPEAILTAEFGSLGTIDFPLSYPTEESILDSIKYVEGNEFLSNVVWSISEKDFVLDAKGVLRGSGRLDLYECVVLDDKLFLAFYGDSVVTMIMDRRKSDFLAGSDLIKNIIETSSDRLKEGEDYVFVPAKLWTKEFGTLFEY